MTEIHKPEELKKRIRVVLYRHKVSKYSYDQMIDELILEVENQLKSQAEFLPPSLAEMTGYIFANQLLTNHSIGEVKELTVLFNDYYESVGWVVGKEKKQMKSWKKALNNWCKRNWSSATKAKMHESVKAHLLIKQQLNED